MLTNDLKYISLWPELQNFVQKMIRHFCLVNPRKSHSNIWNVSFIYGLVFTTHSDLPFKIKKRLLSWHLIPLCLLWMKKRSHNFWAKFWDSDHCEAAARILLTFALHLVQPSKRQCKRTRNSLGLRALTIRASGMYRDVGTS